MTHQLLLNVPDQLYQLLVETAQTKGETPENLVIQYLQEAQIKTQNDPLDQFIGAFNSNKSDWLDQHDEYIGKSSL
jgi:hypothetical protein